MISQFAPGTKPQKYNFPLRNYIIASLSDKLIVVEAGVKSGALSTAGFALKLGKDVYAVPNNIYDEESKGTNILIRNGAKIFLEPEALSYGAFVRDDVKIDDSQFSYKTTDKFIIQLLKNAPMSVDELSKKLSLSTDILIEKLSVMQIYGQITQVPGGQWFAQ